LKIQVSLRIGLLGFFLFYAFQSEAKFLNKADLKQRIDKLIDGKDLVGLSLFLKQGEEEYFIHFGEKKIESHQAANDNSLYEIASITKLFTGLVLAKAMDQGKINENDLAQKYLNYKLPKKAGVEISILDLATHRAGFSEKFLDGVELKDPLNPWASFGVQELVNFLNRSPLDWIPGTQSRYDNIASGILGDVLETIYNKNLESIYRDELLDPVAMSSTSIVPQSESLKNAVQGYALNESQLVECPLWSFASMAAAGGLKSDLWDMSLWARFILNPPNQEWLRILEIAQRPRRQTLAIESEQIGLLWRKMPDPYDMYWHNGGTYGMSSFFGVNKKKNSALVLLANTMSPTTTGLGFEIMKAINE
jgi:CubicO group peptidase (beta-lactamase class C family)